MDPTIILIIGGAIAVLLLVIGVFVSITSERAALEERLEQVVDKDIAMDRKKAIGSRSSPVVDWLNRRVQGSTWADRMSKDLARADLKMKPGEYIALMIIAVIGTGLIAAYLGGFNPIYAIVGGIIGYFLPGNYVKGLQGKRLQKFSDQLGDMLSLMVNGLRAGYSTVQAMEAVSKELPSPICDEFRRVVQEMQLGLPMEQALDNLLRRIPSDDLDLVITAVNVQREVGGNLAEILDTISFTIRERVRIKGEIRVLTTQVMYSGRFLAMMPIFVLGILFVLNPNYMLEYFAPINNMPAKPIPCGWCALICAGLLIIAGYFAMNKLADIEV